jgi:hypothetical protein
MKRFDQFIKEEIDLRGNTGIPDDFMGNAEKQASKNLGVPIGVRQDDRQAMQQHGRQIMDLVGKLNAPNGLVAQSKKIIYSGSEEEVEKRLVALEDLAKEIIIEKYQDILEASEKPVELDIKMLRPGKKVTDEMPDLEDVEATPPPRQEELKDDEIKKSVDKKKILNVINQGEAKATKNIVRFSEKVEPGLKAIFGDKWKGILDMWLEIIDAADKMDWILPTDIKANMMKDAPEGMAGACQVEWKKDEDDEDEEDNDNEEREESCKIDEDGVQLCGDQEDYDKIVIKAIGTDFPMLLHEAVKGIWSLLKSGAIKNDEELAKIIADNTGTYADEAQDFKYGVSMQAMFRDFINACKDSNKYSNMNARVYAKLALDKDNGGDFEDGEFLEISKSIFSSFNLEEGNKLEFVLDADKFNSSTAKKKIEGLISDIVEAEKDYEKQLSEWEMDKQFSDDREEEQDDVDDEEFNDFLSDYGISSKQEEEQEEEEQDLSTMKQSDIQELVDDALDRGDYAEVARVSKYLKEGQEIYIKELERINESLVRRRKNK